MKEMLNQSLLNNTLIVFAFSYASFLDYAFIDIEDIEDICFIHRMFCQPVESN